MDDGNNANDPLHDHGMYILTGRAKEGGYDTVTEKYFIQNSDISSDVSYTPTADDYVEHNPDVLGIILNGLDEDGDMNLIYEIQGFDEGGDAGPTPIFKAEIDGSQRSGGELSYKNDASNIASLSFTPETDNQTVDELHYKNGLNEFGDTSQIIEWLRVYTMDLAGPWEHMVG